MRQRIQRILMRIKADLDIHWQYYQRDIRLLHDELDDLEKENSFDSVSEAVFRMKEIEERSAMMSQLRIQQRDMEHLLEGLGTSEDQDL